jgi:hypothetical protein
MSFFCSSEATNLSKHGKILPGTPKRKSVDLDFSEMRSRNFTHVIFLHPGPHTSVRGIDMDAIIEVFLGIHSSWNNYSVNGYIFTPPFETYAVYQLKFDARSRRSLWRYRHSAWENPKPVLLMVVELLHMLFPNPRTAEVLQNSRSDLHSLSDNWDSKIVTKRVDKKNWRE